MDKGFRENFGKIFGKNKNNRLHAIFMLTVYAIMIGVLVLSLRNTDITKDKKETTTNTSSVVEENNEEKNIVSKPRKIDSDINYSYSYKIIYDNNIETYIGKRVDDKEQFSYIKNNETIKYAILDGNYFIFKGDKYQLIDKLDNSFKYCDVSKILLLVEGKEPVLDGNKFKYSIKNGDIASWFGDIVKNSDLSNDIEILIENDALKQITLNLSNYISSIDGNNHSLNITMDFANIGTTEDFDIEVN